MVKKKHATKFRYHIEFRGASGLPEGACVRLVWKRGAKSANHGITKGKTAVDGTVAWNESVAILCTLFSTSSGAYDQKDIIFTLTQAGLGKKDVTLGKTMVNLADFADPGKPPVVKTHAVRALKRDKGVFKLDIAYSCELISEGDADAMSETDAGGDDLSAADGPDDALDADPFAAHDDAADEKAADMQECLVEALEPYAGQAVLQAIGEQHGLGFLMADGTLTVAQASVISGTDSDPRFEQYYTELPDKQPDVILYDDAEVRDMTEFHEWIETNFTITQRYAVQHGTASLQVLVCG